MTGGAGFVKQSLGLRRVALYPDPGRVFEGREVAATCVAAVTGLCVQGKRLGRVALYTCPIGVQARQLNALEEVT